MGFVPRLVVLKEYFVVIPDYHQTRIEATELLVVTKTSAVLEAWEKWMEHLKYTR